MANTPSQTDIDFVLKHCDAVDSPHVATYEEGVAAGIRWMMGETTESMLMLISKIKEIHHG